MVRNSIWNFGHYGGDLSAQDVPERAGFRVPVRAGVHEFQGEYYDVSLLRHIYSHQLLSHSLTHSLTVSITHTLSYLLLNSHPK